MSNFRFFISEHKTGPKEFTWEEVHYSDEPKNSVCELLNDECVAFLVLYVDGVRLNCFFHDDGIFLFSSDKNVDLDWLNAHDDEIVVPAST
jgi:hypothetical protein